MRLLLVEDDPELGDGLVFALQQTNYAVDWVRSGRDALAALEGFTYGLIVLDLGLPDTDGVDVLSTARRKGLLTPVLILTARDELQDRIQGLDAGGDDYLVKPFAIRELEARIRALLRRGQAASPTIHVGSLEFDRNSRSAMVGRSTLNLTAREISVLELLLQRPGKVVSKQQIVESIYDWSAEANPTAVEVFVSRLRRKLEDADAKVSIRVLRGLGYRLETTDE